MPEGISTLEELLAPDFRIDRQLGEGATSRVYLARDVALDMPVTIKVLKPEIAESPELRARFEREARAAANLVHPNISNVHRFGRLRSGEPYLVIEYVNGRTLAQRLAAEGAFEVPRVRRIVADVAGALTRAHAHGIVHRDIRPGNILIDETDGRAIVTDFGLAAVTEMWTHGHDAKLTKTGQLIGDPRYVSPEQFRGEPVTDATDVYSLAIVAYEMLTLEMPNAAAGGRAAAVARMEGAPVDWPDHLRDEDPELADLLPRCLAADPTNRPSARALHDRLREPYRPGRRRVDDSFLPQWIKDGWRALSRRRLPQWVAGVAAAGWILLEGLNSLIERDVVTAAAYRPALAGWLAAILAAAILAWFHGEKGDQRIRPLELALLALVGAGWILALLRILG